MAKVILSIIFRVKVVLIFSVLISISAGITDGKDYRVTDPVSLPSYDQIMMDSLEAFYQTEWEKAEIYFKSMKELDPADPRAYFFSSMIPFWEYFFVDQSEESAKDFFMQSNEAIILGEEKLRKNPGDKMLISMLSGLYGYQSLVASGENNIRTALRAGRTGFGYTKKLLEFDESIPETQIGKGMYHYMVGSVPGALRWLVRLFGLKGDVETGFEELKKAAESDSYVSVDAKMILAYIYSKEEEYEEALYYLSRLRLEYPGNTIFQYVYAETLENAGCTEEALIEYEKVIVMNNPELKQLHAMGVEKINLLN